MKLHSNGLTYYVLQGTTCEIEKYDGAENSVVIPQILPGILSGFMLAITLSLDDYVITAYTKPDSFKTISTHIYGLDKNNVVGPKIKAAYWAFTAIIFFIIVAVVVVANVMSYRKTRGKKK